MALTPSDIEQKTFSTALRGYDLDEVDDFLDEVVATIRDLQDRLAQAGQGATSPPSTQTVDESAVGRVLITAQETADNIVSDARTESERILEEAKAEADSWSAERDRKKAEADSEMAELTEHVSNIRNQLAVLATAVADRLDEMDQVIATDADLVESETDAAYASDDGSVDISAGVDGEEGEDANASGSAITDEEVSSLDEPEAEADADAIAGSAGVLAGGMGMPEEDKTHD